MVPTNANPILVPQPRAHLQSLHPANGPSSGYYDLQTKAPTTYIGSVSPALTLPPARAPADDVEHGITSKIHRVHPSGSRRNTRPLLFALSSESYPLINFAPPPKPGSLTNGSFLVSEIVPEQDQLLPYLLDPPAEDTALIPVVETGVVEAEVYVKPPVRRNWIWWTASLVLCGLAFFRHHQRKFVKQSDSPADEKTPLLLGPATTDTDETVEKPVKVEKSVTIVEPQFSPLQKNATLPGEEEATPKKKSTRRRVRGKKKRRDSNAASPEKEDDEDDEEDKGDSSSTPPGTVVKRGDKPLPELPREISTTALADEEDKERLVISDTIIGESTNSAPSRIACSPTGFGSHGTVVLKGTWGGRPVAVKRLLSDFTRLASQEVKLLQASDDHPNVIRCKRNTCIELIPDYCQDRRDNFLYIALDLCQASLADLIESPDKHVELASVLDRKKALMQVTAGLKHLHGMKIIHRDIKPQYVRELLSLRMLTIETFWFLKGKTGLCACWCLILVSHVDSSRTSRLLRLRRITLPALLVGERQNASEVRCD